jgi:hypothetical protein
MNAGPSPTCGVRAVTISSVSGLSLATTLISPLIAVCLSQYLRSHESQHTTFAMPVANISAGLPAEPCPAPRLEPSVVEELPRAVGESRQTVAVSSETPMQAKTLIERASGLKDDPARQFVMLRLAKDVAIRANDGQTAFLAIDAMDETFHVDADAMKLAVLAKFAAAAKQPAQHKAIADRALKLANEAAGQGHSMIARQLGKLALVEAKKAHNRELLVQVEGQMAEAREQVAANKRRMKPSGDLRR